MEKAYCRRRFVMLLEELGRFPDVTTSFGTGRMVDCGQLGAVVIMDAPDGREDRRVVLYRDIRGFSEMFKAGRWV